MDFSESPEQIALREAVASVASGFGHEYYVRKSRTGEKATELWEAMASQGFLGVNIDESYGGGGVGIYELQLVLEELSAHGCPLLMMVVSPAICGTVIQRYGTSDQRNAWLPGLASGTVTMAIAITESEAGSNSYRISTSATRAGDAYVIRGTKHFISGVDEADALLVVTRTSADSAGRDRLSLFVVPTDSPGLSCTPISVEVLAPDRQFMLFFDDVRVPATNLVGMEGEGFRPLFTGLNPERIMSAALVNGVARYALERAADYARVRQVWNAPIGTYQGIAHPLAEAKVNVEMARLMTAKAAWLFDAGEPAAGEAANMAKFAAAEAGLAALDQAIQTHGGNGMTTEYGLATLWGAVRLMRIAPVSREMILNFVAQHSLGLPRSY